MGPAASVAWRSAGPWASGGPGDRGGAKAGRGRRLRNGESSGSSSSTALSLSSSSRVARSLSHLSKEATGMSTALPAWTLGMSGSIWRRQPSDTPSAAVASGIRKARRFRRSIEDTWSAIRSRAPFVSSFSVNRSGLLAAQTLAMAGACHQAIAKWIQFSVGAPSSPAARHCSDQSSRVPALPGHGLVVLASLMALSAIAAVTTRTYVHRARRTVPWA